MVWERTHDGQGGSRLGCSQGLRDERLGGINCPQISKWSFFFLFFLVFLVAFHLLFMIKVTYACFKQI